MNELPKQSCPERRPVQRKWNPKPANPPVLNPESFQKTMELALDCVDVVMGLDPGFAEMGVAVIGRTAEKAKPQLLHLGTIKTEKGKKKERINLRVTNDDQRRYDEIYEALEAIRQRFRPTAVGVEAYHPHKDVTTGWKTAVVYGGVIFWAKSQGIYCAPYIPQDLKRRFCGKQSGSKQEVAAVAAVMVEGAWEAYLATAKTRQEHVGDALGHSILVLEEVDRVRKIVRGMP